MSEKIPGKNLEARPQGYDGLERRLSLTFRQLLPDANYVARVKKRLISTPAVRVERGDPQSLAFSLLGIAFLILAILLGRWTWRFLTKK